MCTIHKYNFLRCDEMIGIKKDFEKGGSFDCEPTEEVHHGSAEIRLFTEKVKM